MILAALDPPEPGLCGCRFVLYHVKTGVPIFAAEKERKRQEIPLHLNFDWL